MYFLYWCVAKTYRPLHKLIKCCECTLLAYHVIVGTGIEVSSSNLLNLRVQPFPRSGILNVADRWRSNPGSWYAPWVELVHCLLPTRFVWDLFFLVFSGHTLLEKILNPMYGDATVVTISFLSLCWASHFPDFLDVVGWAFFVLAFSLSILPLLLHEH